ncbi:MAG: ribonuclease D, partial [Rhodobacteraceae bacterium]|nr:ribonuclease D [Paracoccaceae bacterium]
SGTEHYAVLVDALAGDIDLKCFFALMTNPGIVKVVHAGGQDIEIFWHLGKCIPNPLFDTQIAAMVCGFGYQASYASLVEALTDQSMPGSATITNWQQRPLTERQMHYAVADVTHLRAVYTRLLEMLETNGRRSWLDEEFSRLANPSNIEQDPMTAWKKLKVNRTKPAVLAIVRELAAMRERMAAEQNRPRKHIMADHALMEIAQHQTRNPADLRKTRFYNNKGKINRYGPAILAAVRRGLECPPELYPRLSRRSTRPVSKAALELLRILLAAKAEEHGVAEQHIATADDLKSLIRGDINGSVMRGWRHDLFGRDASRLCQGKIALVIDGGSVRIVDREQGGGQAVMHMMI